MRWGKTFQQLCVQDRKWYEDSSLSFLFFYFSHMARKESSAGTGRKVFTGWFWGEEVKPGITQSLRIITVKIVVS
jgi:hypothetical protein